jgi:hypothetical protein
VAPLVLLLVGVTGLVLGREQVAGQFAAQLESLMGQVGRELVIWGVRPASTSGVWAGIRAWLKSRVFSLGLVCALAFLLVVPLVLSIPIHTWKGALPMAEPTAQRLRVTFAATRTDNDRFVIVCEPLASESTPVLPGSDPAESDAAVAASDPTETEAVIRGSERDPTLISGVFAFELQEGVTEAQARHLAQQMTDLVSHVMYTPR